MQIMRRIQFDIPYEAYLRLLRHPDCPGWRGRNKFFRELLMNQINSPDFELKELEKENRRLTRERDQARQELGRKAKADEFLKRVQSGEFFRSQSPKPQEGPATVSTAPPIEGRTDSVH
jgi:hypothetical protein